MPCSPAFASANSHSADAAGNHTSIEAMSVDDNGRVLTVIGPPLMRLRDTETALTGTAEFRG